MKSTVALPTHEGLSTVKNFIFMMHHFSIVYEK